MKWTFIVAAAVGFATGAIAEAPLEPTIEGHYVEARTCDVFTGPCFANSETGLTGQEALMVWNVSQGSWNDIDLSGLTVMAAVRAAATLGDSYHNPYPAKSVVLVDDAASEKQREALVDMAKAMGGLLLNDVVAVETVPMEATIGACDKTGACASVKAGEVAAIKTRCLNDGDHVCGNETAFYPPLTEVEGAIPAYTAEGTYTGEGLDATWAEHGRRGAFIATFAR